MAQVLSGSFNTTAYGNRYLTFSWTATQSIDNNQTTIKWNLDAAGSYTGYYKAGNFKVVIAGETVFTSSTRVNLTQTYHVADGTKVITHNNNGSQSFSASVEAGIYTVAVNCTGNGKWDLKDIPRKATITSAPDFNNNSTELTINISNPLGTKAATAISIGTDANNALFAFETFTGNSHKFKLDATKINTLLLNTPKNSRSVSFILRTFVNNTYYWHTVNKTFSVVNGAPTLNPVIDDEHPKATQLTGNLDTIISGYNTVSVEINATALTGATITKQSVTCGGKTLTENTNLFSDVTSGTFVVSATDSRGNTTTQTINKTLISYFKPTITLTKNAITTDGTYLVSVSGKFFNGSFGAVNNTADIEFKWYADGVWGDWQPLQPQINNNNFTAEVNITGLNYQDSYDIQARIVDKINTIPTDVITVTSIPVFSWNKNNFEHNTTVTFTNQKGIYGIDTEGNHLQCFLPCNTNNNLVIGYGSYQNETGNTNIYAGADINLITKGKINIGGREYGAKVLYTSGGLVMDNTHSISLTGDKAITKQPNGIVIAWSAYVGGTGVNYGWHFTYIPKQLVISNPTNAKISTGIMCSSDFSVAGTKVLIVEDTKITGYDANSLSGTGSSGIKYNNAYYVLRYVIGV